MIAFTDTIVYLVGAGPGDPDLLTVKAQRLLNRCDAVVYDSLISQELLESLPNSCRRFFVGKRRGNHSFSQDQINKLLVDLAKNYSCIVRLKGGDPFLFGRGSEEAEYLVKSQIKVEVVPGITSGMAVPAYFGIPVTHRNGGSSVTFVTGHESSSKQKTSVNWRALAKATDALVIYMGMHNLDFIVKELLAGGLDPKTPSAVIHQGTLISQQYLKASLNKLVEADFLVNFSSPSIVIIGRVIDHQVKECSPEIANLNPSKLDKLINLGVENNLHKLINLPINS